MAVCEHPASISVWVLPKPRHAAVLQEYLAPTMEKRHSSLWEKNSGRWRCLDNRALPSNVQHSTWVVGLEFLHVKRRHSQQLSGNMRHWSRHPDHLRSAQELQTLHQRHDRTVVYSQHANASVPIDIAVPLPYSLGPPKVLLAYPHLVVVPGVKTLMTLPL